MAMLENGFCTIIVNSMHMGYKIPDPTGMYAMTTKRCCDIIGNLENNGIINAAYIEAKYNKEMSAFNLNRIEPHQAYYLTEFGKASNSICYIILGVHVSRGDLRAYIFDWKDLKPFYDNKASIHAKLLQLLPYNEIHKEKFEFTNIIHKQNLIEAGVK